MYAAQARWGFQADYRVPKRVSCFTTVRMRYYLYEFTVLTVIHVLAQDHPRRLRLLLRRDRNA